MDTKKIISMAFFCLFATHTQAMEKTEKYVLILVPDYGEDRYGLKITPGERAYSTSYEDLDKDNLEKHLRSYEIRALTIVGKSVQMDPTYIDIIADVLKKLRFEQFVFDDFRYMNLSQKNFKTILGSLPRDLQELSLRRNGLKALLPEIVGRFTKLKILNLFDNKLQKLPAIELLSELETLIIKKNNISSEKIKELRKKLPNTNISADH